MTTKQQCLLAAAAFACVATASAQETHHLMRYADVHGDRIVFTYEDDLWLVSTEGGLARRITNDPGAEAWAKFSPDGKWLAFTGQYDGGTDVYVMAAEGGSPKRLTWHPARDRVLDWHPDGAHVLFRSNRVWPHRGEEVYLVSIAGGLPERLPVDRAGLAALSPDGKELAYNRGSRESRTWKRHRGGTAQDIWMGSLAEQDYRKVIDSDWSDNFPMWHDTGLYFNSDREDGTLNIYRYEPGSGNISRITQFKEYDVKYPSLGDDRIVFQHEEMLKLVDIPGGNMRTVPVRIPTDGVRMRPEFVRVSPRTGAFGVSPDGKLLLLEARGEIVAVPKEEGVTVQISNSPQSREKNCAWSPDGTKIAFISDRSGEEQVYLGDVHGGEWTQLTDEGIGFRMQLVWSPDGKWIIFSDKFMNLNLVDVANKTLTVLDTADYDDAWERWGIQDYVWSPNSQWIAYTKMERSMNESLFVYSLEQQETYRLTEPRTREWSPSFSPDGKYLYFLSERDLSPVMGAIDQNHVFLDVTRPYVMLLREGQQSPFHEADPYGVHAMYAEAEGAEFAIDLDGICRRVIACPGVSKGNYFRLTATDDGFLMLAKSAPEFLKYQNVNDGTTDRMSLHHYKVAEASLSKLMDGIANYHLSADGKQMVYRSGDTYGIVATGSKGSVGDGKVDLSNAYITVNRRQEFLQMFDEAWRIQRDWFYDKDMHGVDWDAIRDKYRKYVKYAGTRGDLTYLIGEMIAELNIGHTYVFGGDVSQDARRVNVGLLGCEFVDKGRGAEHYRIGMIYPNQPLVPGEESPLDMPGCPIKTGHYIIQINGQKLTTDDNPYEFLQNLAGDYVWITYNTEPSMDGAKVYRVRALRSERGIQYRQWVESNLAFVEKESGGRLGYVHLPNMMDAGLTEFARYYYPQYYKQGMIIDARYNGGGFTGSMIIDRLEREIYAMTKPREGGTWRDPERVFVGPWIVLINEDTGSNGEMFAEAIKIKELAPLLGMRTWGGSIGIEPHQDLVDGGVVTPPQFGLYGLDGRWIIEGRGVEPDIKVQNMPADVLRGKDAQLEAAIKFLLEALEDSRFVDPPPPAYPDKSRPRGS